MSIVLVLLTALFSGITAALCTFYLNEGKERWQLRRQKIEDIYVGADRWTKDLTLHYSSWFLVIRGELTVDQINELTIESGKKAAEEDEARLASRLEMNVFLYQPDLSGRLKTLMEIRDQLSRLVSKIKQEYRIGGIQRKERHGELDTLLNAWNATSDQFMSDIITIGRSIASEPSQAHAAAAALKADLSTRTTAMKTRIRSLKWPFSRGD